MSEKRNAYLKTLHSLPVYWDEYELYGQLDYAEIEGKLFRIVEYKPSQKNLKSPESDLMQLFLQKKCVENIYLNYDIECYFYYADTKRRILVDFGDEDLMVRKFISIKDKIEDFKAKGVIPLIEKNQYCRGCSIKDLCLPKTKSDSLKSRIKKSLNMEAKHKQ